MLLIHRVSSLRGEGEGEEPRGRTQRETAPRQGRYCPRLQRPGGPRVNNEGRRYRSTSTGNSYRQAVAKGVASRPPPYPPPMAHYATDTCTQIHTHALALVTPFSASPGRSRFVLTCYRLVIVLRKEERDVHNDMSRVALPCHPGWECCPYIKDGAEVSPD